jgi:peptidoglycan/LPS O-acetylase OafA/YrhL
METAPAFNTAVHGLRGVASIMVFFAHLLGGAAEHVYADRIGYVNGVEPFWNFGTYGVYLFFAISGFVIVPSVIRYSIGDFFVRRVWRIYPIFLFFSVLFVIGNYFTNFIPDVNNPTAILAGLTFTNILVGTEQLTPNAWSLTYEVMFYGLAATVFYFAVSHRNPFGFAIAIALSLLFVFKLPAALFFVIGVGSWYMYSVNWVVRPQIKPWFEIASLFALIAISTQGHFGYYQNEMSDPVALATMAATAVFFYFAVDYESITSRVLNVRWIMYLGTVSYSLYLVHPYVYMPMRVAFVKLGWFSDNILFSLIIFISTVSFLTLLATHLAHVFLEKWPYKYRFSKDPFSPKKSNIIQSRSI